ncbi:MAG: hypothetical protein K2X57_04470 [Xanthobacteraceae bacterium]|nr:hypothetical protein [Xanthobacteraceae bacterium]
MTRRWVLTAIAAILAVLIALAFIYPHRMVSPGPLIAAHEKLTADCFACHAPLRGAVAERCIRCHVVANIGLQTTTGAPIARTADKVPFHRSLASKDCMACHSDHPLPSFTATSRVNFSHSLLDPAMSAKCTTCHTAPVNDFHRDPAATCSQCHSRDRWKPATLDHSRFFELDRDHNATCVTCHTSSDFGRYTCFGCHEHQPSALRAKHLKEGISNFENCVSCHRNAHDEPKARGSRKKDDD